MHPELESLPGRHDELPELVERLIETRGSFDRFKSSRDRRLIARDDAWRVAHEK